MSIQLHPDIEGLDKESLCYLIYAQLYDNFYRAQDQKDDEHPWGIEEGDENSIRLKNTAYGFAHVISDAIDTGGGNGGADMNYIQKSGDSMLGELKAYHGFQAGIKNICFLETFSDSISGSGTKYGIKINQQLRIGGTSFFMDEENVLSYNKLYSTTTVKGEIIKFDASSISTTASITVGKDAYKGVQIEPTSITILNNKVYHSGNANMISVDWEMNNGTLQGVLTAGKTAIFKQGFEDILGKGSSLGAGGNVKLMIKASQIFVYTPLNLQEGCGIKVNNKYILQDYTNKDIQIGSTGGDFIIGNDTTNKIKLYAGVTDINGENLLITKYGGGYFPESLRVRHNFGDDLLYSYREDKDDEGIIINKRLRFGTPKGIFLSGNNNSLILHGEAQGIAYSTTFNYQPSTSYYKIPGQNTHSLFISSDSDFFIFNKPVESKNSLGIEGSSTRLLNNSLFFSNTNYLLSTVDGIKHYGHAYFLQNISSEKYSSGFAGSGWAINQNATTGNYSATFDEITIRKKMRIYELEVQKQSVVNGSFWVSDSCSGDEVIRIR